MLTFLDRIKIIRFGELDKERRATPKHYDKVEATVRGEV